MAIKYVPYPPTVLHGQAVLSNFERTRKQLYYKGDTDVEGRISRGMPLYEVKRKEIHGEPSDNLVIRGECVSACAYLRQNNISVDLVYIDPPFASGADYAKKVYLRRNPNVQGAIKKAEAMLDNADMQFLESKMYGDIWDKERYLNWMYENLMAIKSVMSPTASIYVHLDFHIGHYVKILMDEVFGEGCFRNEIVWAYRIQGISKGAWPKKHDTIFYYTLNPEEAVFNPEKETIIYEKPFIDTECSSPDMSRISDKERDKIFDSIKNNRPLKDSLKKMLFNTYSTEVYVRDVWDCDSTRPLISGSSEYVNYKTQKPEGLLARIINASSNKGMVVADFFGGSGVAAAVASKLGRKFIHVDVSNNSVQTARDRLVKDGVSFVSLDVLDGVSLYRNPVQTDEIIPTLIEGLVRDSSLGAVWTGVINDSKFGRIPVYIPKLQNGAESRVLSVAFLQKLLYEEVSRLAGSSVKKIIIYFIDRDSPDVIDECVKQHNNTLIEIEFRDLKELLDKMTAEDEAQLDVSETGDGLMTKWTVGVVSFFSDRVRRKIEEYNQKALCNPKKTYPTIALSDEGLESIEWLSLDSTTAELDAEWHSDAEVKIENDNYISINGVKTKNMWDGTISSHQRPLRIKIRNICGDESVFPITY